MIELATPIPVDSLPAARFPGRGSTKTRNFVKTIIEDPRIWHLIEIHQASEDVKSTPQARASSSAQAHRIWAQQQKFTPAGTIEFASRTVQTEKTRKGEKAGKEEKVVEIEGRVFARFMPREATTPTTSNTVRKTRRKTS